MIIAINFADSKYENQRKLNTKSAYEKGKADKVIEYSLNDIDEDFKKQNEKILSYERGAGLWLWKPYLILKTLEQIEDDDYLFYVDSGSFFIKKISILVAVMETHKQDIMGFELPLSERQFTKNETFYLTDYEDSGLNQILGSFAIFKKSQFSILFVQQWLNLMCDERIVSPNHYCSFIEESPDFVTHREDQSVFSILYHKYKLTPFRDPSQYGIWPWEYMWRRTFNLPNWIYQPNKAIYETDTYPTILASNRLVPYRKFMKRYFFKLILYRIGLYNGDIYHRFVNWWDNKKSIF